MSKSILVIDTPVCCRECPLCREDHQTYRDYCSITADYIWTMDKPDWCQLIPLPEKYEIDESKYNDRPRPEILGGTIWSILILHSSF